MQPTQKHKEISNTVLKFFLENSLPQTSKLSLLEEYCQANSVSYNEDISSEARQLTKKIYGTGVKSIVKDLNISLFPNLTSLAYVFLVIAFQDEYLIKFALQQIKQSAPNLQKIINNPLNKLQIDGADLRTIICEVVLKITNWRQYFNISDILDNYYLGPVVFGLLLRSILVKLKYSKAEDLSFDLPTADIFAIICQYFDLNMMAKNVRDRPSCGKFHQIFLFTEQNLFVSTHNNLQFCCGRYYENQSELLRAEKVVRKSTLEFFMNSKISGIENEEENAKKQNIKMSQFELDLGMSTSGFLFPNPQQESPYFNSNIPTPQFCNIFDSFRIKRSTDFESVPEMEKSNIQQQYLLKNSKMAMKSSFLKNEKTQSIIINGAVSGLTNSEEIEMRKVVLEKGEKENQEGKIENHWQPLSPPSDLQKEKHVPKTSNPENFTIPIKGNLSGYKQCQSQRPIQQGQNNEDTSGSKQASSKAPPKFGHYDPQTPQDNEMFPSMTFHKFQQYEKYNFTGAEEKSSKLNVNKEMEAPEIGGESRKTSKNSSSKKDRKYSTNNTPSTGYDKNSLYNGKPAYIYSSNYLDQKNVEGELSKSVKCPKFETKSDWEQINHSDDGSAVLNNRKMGLASNTVSFKMEGKKSATITPAFTNSRISDQSKVKTQNEDQQVEFLVISKHPGKSGFKKKRSEQQFLNFREPDNNQNSHKLKEKYKSTKVLNFEQADKFNPQNLYPHSYPHFHHYSSELEGSGSLQLSPSDLSKTQAPRRNTHNDHYQHHQYTKMANEYRTAPSEINTSPKFRSGSPSKLMKVPQMSTLHQFHSNHKFNRIVKKNSAINEVKASQKSPKVPLFLKQKSSNAMKSQCYLNPATPTRNSPIKTNAALRDNSKSPKKKLSPFNSSFTKIKIKAADNLYSRQKKEEENNSYNNDLNKNSNTRSQQYLSYGSAPNSSSNWQTLSKQLDYYSINGVPYKVLPPKNTANLLCNLKEPSNPPIQAFVAKYPITTSNSTIMSQHDSDHFQTASTPAIIEALNYRQRMNQFGNR